MTKVKIDKVSLPFNMEYVLFFVSLWDLKRLIQAEIFILIF